MQGGLSPEASAFAKASADRLAKGDHVAIT
jgi:hypothetical protein